MIRMMVSSMLSPPNYEIELVGLTFCDGASDEADDQAAYYPR